jgi:transposase
MRKSSLVHENPNYKTAEIWVGRVETTGFKALKAFVSTLQNWWQHILNYFDGRYNNGFADGVNLKTKMLNRRGYDYRNFQSFRLHVLVALDPVSR